MITSDVTIEAFASFDGADGLIWEHGLNSSEQLAHGISPKLDSRLGQLSTEDLEDRCPLLSYLMHLEHKSWDH